MKRKKEKKERAQNFFSSNSLPCINLRVPILKFFFPKKPKIISQNQIFIWQHLIKNLTASTHCKVMIAL